MTNKRQSNNVSNVLLQVILSSGTYSGFSDTPGTRSDLLRMLQYPSSIDVDDSEL